MKNNLTINKSNKTTRVEWRWAAYHCKNKNINSLLGIHEEKKHITHRCYDKNPILRNIPVKVKLEYEVPRRK